MGKNKCCCGCGAETQNWFAPGYDAKARSILLKVKRRQEQPEIIPQVLIDFVLYQNGIAPFWQKEFLVTVQEAQRVKHPGKQP